MAIRHNYPYQIRIESLAQSARITTRKSGQPAVSPAAPLLFIALLRLFQVVTGVRRKFLRRCTWTTSDAIQSGPNSGVVEHLVLVAFQHVVKSSGRLLERLLRSIKRP